jgi:hypothetical protein
LSHQKLDSQPQPSCQVEPGQLRQNDKTN